jgi:septal ring factor EnvC (AmiA/AmiB activator)
MGEAAVKIGDLVEKGAKLGVAGPPDDHQRNFYFEIRQNGTPVEPEQFFSRKL